MKTTYFAVMAVVASVCLVGCGGGDFPTAKVTGTVLCDGKPVAGAMVFFEPVKAGEQEGSALVGKQGFSYTNDNGEFEIATYSEGEPDGAVVGPHRVRVGLLGKPCNCVTDSERDVMNVEVKASEDNVFEVVLPPKTARDKQRDKKNAADEEDL